MMKKYLILGLSIIPVVHGMETPLQLPRIDTICKWTKNDYDNGYNPLIMAHYHIINKYPLDDLVVFNVNRNEGFAAYLARTAKIVHSIDEENSTNIYETQQKYARTLNLVFMKEVSPEAYDVFTMFQLPSKDTELREFLLEYYDGLKPSGEIFGTIITQDNKNSVEQPLAQNIYLEIYNSLPQEKQCTLDKNIHAKKNFITQQILKEIICETGYEILSQTNRFFEFHIEDITSFKKLLKIGFATIVLNPLQLSPEQNKFYRKKFALLVIAQLKRNNKKEPIYPYNITEIHLRKK